VAAFQSLKIYLASPPLLSKPTSGERLFLYLAVSKPTVSGALIRGDEGVQKPIYYISHSMSVPQTRYQRLKKPSACPLHHLEEAQALLPDFPDHGPYGASPAKHHRKSRSNVTDVEMDIRAKALWTQIRTEDSNQRTSLGGLYC